MKAATMSAFSFPVPHRAQVGALPLRRAPSGDREVLLLTSRETRRWVIPKGWPMKGKKKWQAAAQEAAEEAGVVGKVGKRAIGRFEYMKRHANHWDLCRVAVYLLEFETQLDKWREKGQREARWFQLDEAAALVQEPGLAALLLGLKSHGQVSDSAL